MKVLFKPLVKDRTVFKQLFLSAEKSKQHRFSDICVYDMGLTYNILECLLKKFAF
jgi:hypothetical protein